MSNFVQAPRGSADGAVTVSRDCPPGMLRLSAETNDEIETITLSEYNAARLFGMLSLFLNIPLSAKVGKAIKL